MNNELKNDLIYFNQQILIDKSILKKSLNLKFKNKKILKINNQLNDLTNEINELKNEGLEPLNNKNNILDEILLRNSISDAIEEFTQTSNFTIQESFENNNSNFESPISKPLKNKPKSPITFQNFENNKNYFNEKNENRRNDMLRLSNSFQNDKISLNEFENFQNDLINKSQIKTPIKKNKKILNQKKINLTPNNFKKIKKINLNNQIPKIKNNIILPNPPQLNDSIDQQSIKIISEIDNFLTKISK